MTRFFITDTLNGNIRVWTIERFEDRGVTVVEYYQLNSKEIVSTPIDENKTAHDKRIKDKIKSGYVEVQELPLTTDRALAIIRAAIKERPFKAPMKCQKYDPVKFKYPCLGQPKFNGVRCYIIWGKVVEGTGIFSSIYEGVILLSSEGNRYYVPHVADKFTKDMFCADGSDEPVFYFDGELYVYGEKLNVIKSRIPIEINGTISKPKLPVDPVRFYCFDVAIEDSDYRDRQIIRNSRINNEFNISHFYNGEKIRVNTVATTTSVIYVPDRLIANVSEAQAFTDACIAAGFEGSVLRQFDNTYQYGKRPDDILKIKRYEDGEFIVVDVIPKPSGTGCLFVCKNDINDAVFECNPKGSHDYQHKVLANKDEVIGKKVTIKYYERSGVKKCPFHGNVETIRDYE